MPAANSSPRKEKTMAFFVAGYNVGTDFSASMLDNFGDAFPLDAFGLMTEFESESLDKELEVIPINQGGVPVFQTIWAGVRGRMGFVRSNTNLTSLVIDLMQTYHKFGVIPIFTMAASVLNRDGSIDEYIYTGVQLSRPRFGNFRSEKEVDQAIEFRAGRLKRTGANGPFLVGVPT
jgi:hypothetical protein